MPLNIDWQQILLHLFNFVVLFAILYFLLYEPVKKFMDQRCEYYKKMDDEAKKNLQDAENVKNEYTEKLACVDSEIEEKRVNANKSLNEKTQKAVEQAKDEAEKIVAEAKKKALLERNKMVESAQNEIADMVSAATEKIVVNATTHDAYDNFLSAVKRSESNDR